MKELKILLDYAGTTDNLWLSYQLIKVRDQIKKERNLLIMSMEAMSEQLADAGDQDKLNKINSMLVDYKAVAV